MISLPKGLPEPQRRGSLAEAQLTNESSPSETGSRASVLGQPSPVSLAWSTASLFFACFSRLGNDPWEHEKCADIIMMDSDLVSCGLW